MLPVPPSVIYVITGDGGIGEVHIEVRDHCGRDESARSRAQAFGNDQEVGVDDSAVVQRGGDVVTVVGGVGYLCAEPVVGAFDSALDQDPGQLTTQDLQFSCGTIGFARGRHGERCCLRAVRLHEAHALFAGIGRTHVVVDAHPADDLAGGTAYVDVLALVATLRETLDDGGFPAARGELMSQRRSTDAGTGDDSVRSQVSKILSATAPAVAGGSLSYLPVERRRETFAARISRRAKPSRSLR